MPNFNQLLYAGHLTREPNLKFLPNQTPCCEISIAANRKWKDQNKNVHEEVCYVDFVSFGKQAELINQFCSKGSAVLVDGRLKYDVFDGKDGKRHGKLFCVVNNVQFLSGCKKKDTDGNETSDAEQSPPFTPGKCDDGGVPF